MVDSHLSPVPAAMISRIVPRIVHVDPGDFGIGNFGPRLVGGGEPVRRDFRRQVRLDQRAHHHGQQGFGHVDILIILPIDLRWGGGIAKR